MGYIDFGLEPHHKKRVELALKSRGLKPDFEEDWEIHGPHQDMNYQIYIGYAYAEPVKGAKCICPNKKLQLVRCPAHRRDVCVAIYPKAVYEIEDPSKWGEDAKPENRICVKTKKSFS